MTKQFWQTTYTTTCIFKIVSWWWFQNKIHPIYIYNILGVCLFDRPFHPSIPSFVPSSIRPSSSSRKKKMMEEEDDDEWQQQQFIQMFMWSNMCSAGLVREPVGGEELGLLQAMTTTGASLSLALNIVATSTYPSLAVIFQPCVSFNSQQTLQWDFVVGENYSSKKKIFKAFSTFSSSSLGATTGLSLRFPHQQGVYLSGRCPPQG